MNDCTDIRLDLLLFSVGGVHFGVDASQVARIAVYDGEQPDGLIWFHEELEYRGVAPAYISPMVITLKTKYVQSYRVIIDSMEEIAEYSQDDISLFPALLEPFALRMGLWGVLVRQGRMILLLDFQRLLRERGRDSVDE